MPTNRLNNLLSGVGTAPDKGDLNVIALAKGKEKYIFLFTDKYRDEVLLKIDRFASNPELSFTQYNAETLAKKIRKLSQS